ncbi:MAG: NAD-dependent epimerase/dehydratase family protein [Candidatus Altiarchaeota archaeon]
MNVFVSGGAGFIGSHLVDRLVSGGDKVTVYDNLSSGKRQFIEKHVSSGSVRLVEADLLDFDTLTKELSGQDFVYHLAANPDIRYGIKHTRWDLEQNTVVTYNVLEAMRLNGVKVIVFPSTSAVYGEPSVIPTPEDYGPLLPISLYGASKLACEALVSAYCGTFSFKAFIFRFANVVGGRGTHGVVYDFMEKLGKNPRQLEVLGDGKQVKSYLLVDEILDAIEYVLKHGKDNLNVYNLGCGDQVSVTEIAETVIKQMRLKDVSIKYTGGRQGWPGDVAEMNLSTEKINKLGWKAKHNSKQAVKTGVKDMLSNI